MIEYEWEELGRIKGELNYGQKQRGEKQRNQKVRSVVRPVVMVGGQPRGGGIGRP